jgi:CRP/FNR family cyclic AMP-dependent transcriptional regulator
MFQQADLTQTLQGIPWFLELSPIQIEKLANLGLLRQLKAGEMLYCEGVKQDYLYIILDGKISLDFYVPTVGQTHVYTAEALDILGWDPFAPVIRQRLSDATAASDSLLLAFPGEAFRNLCDEDHELGFIIYRRLANVVASRLINIRLALSDAIVNISQAHNPF